MKQVKAKFYPKTELIAPIEEASIPEEISGDTPLKRAIDQKGIDENFEEHGKFNIITFITGEEERLVYDAKKQVKKDTVEKISEEEWNNL